MDVEAVFGHPRPVVGMIHLPPLPGAPRYDPDGGRERFRERARTDAERLVAGGVDALLVENYGDAPFHPGRVPRSVVAELTALTRTVRAAADLPVGINVLRNDAPSAVAVAAAAGARFVRANVHVGARVTDQGLLEGRAHETLRLRERLDAEIAVLADVGVKHSAPLAGGTDGGDAGGTVAEAVERGLADGIVVTGEATGRATPLAAVERAVERRDALAAAGRVPVFVASGVTPDNAGDFLSVADGAIVGTALKEGAETAAPVDVDRVERLVDAADAARA